MDFAVEKCIDDDGNQRCSKPFLVEKATCYNIEWSTEGTLSHTTVEVKDAGSGEMVYYRDTNGEWTPENGEVSFYPREMGKREANNVLMGSWFILTLSQRSGKLVTIPLMIRLLVASKYKGIDTSITV
jgi:hypothetical protein